MKIAMDVTYPLYIYLFKTFMIFAFDEIRGTAACASSEYQCFNGECIPLEGFCDERPDCKDMSDEEDCYNECLLRDDVVGKKYRGERQITAQGLYCDQPCRWLHGTAPQCASSDGNIHYCQIPTCGGKVVLNGSTNARLVLRSPVVEKHTDFMCVRLDYSLKKTRNLDIKLVDWGPYDGVQTIPTVLDQSNAECDHCVRHIDIYADEMFQYQAKIFIFLFPQGDYELVFEIRTIVVEDVECFGTLGEEVMCPEERFRCARYRCVPTDFINDQFTDCAFGVTELPWDYRESCGPTSIQCHASNSCLLSSSPIDLIVQCIGSQTHLPVQSTQTLCPSYHTCKHVDIVSSSSQTCVSETEVCDGVPQCPHWDDEMDCPIFCPSECRKCDLRRFHCPPSALNNISTRIPYLDISGYHIELKTLCSVQRLRLVFLNVSSSGLTNVSCLCDTDLFPRLQVWDASNNNISVVYRTKYQDNHHLHTLILDQNPILLIMINVRVGFLSVRNCSIHTILNTESSIEYPSINLAFNSIPYWYRNLPKKTFAGCSISRLDLSYNKVENIEPLNQCGELQDLNLHQNSIKDITNSSFADRYHMLVNFTLSANMIEILHAGFFERFINLQLLNLSLNIIHEINVNAFRKIGKLLVLDISRNRLTSVPDRIFDDLINLAELYLKGNAIEMIHQSLFRTTTKLEILDLSNNKISLLPRKLFLDMKHLHTLDLRGNDIIVTSTMFGGLGVLQYLKVARLSLCCVRPSSVLLSNCEAEDDLFPSCSHLLGSKFLSVIIWLMICSSVCGNIFLHLLKRLKLPRSEACAHCLITNMAAVDILMGFYLFVIGFVDVAYRGSYGLFHDSWRIGVTCITAGVMATSSMLGVNIFLLVHCGFRLCRIDKKRVFGKYLDIILTTIPVTLAVSIAGIPVMTSHRQFYSLTNICVPLPVTISVIRSPYAEYSIGFYIVANASTIFILVLCEIILTKTYNQDKEKMDTTMVSGPYTKIFLAYLFTHCLRFIPIFLLGLMTLMEWFISDDIYIFVAVFIMPMSAVLNPILQSFFINSNQSVFTKGEVRLKTIYPNNIRVIKRDYQDIFLVTESKIPRNHNVIIIFRGESGWMQKVTEVKIINKVIKCRTPTYHGDHSREKVSIQIQVEEQRSNSCSIEFST